jgi:hypothetical protein
LTPVANNGNNGNCLNLEVKLKKKNFLFVNSTTQRFPN